MPNIPYCGSCLCGSIKYEVDSIEDKMANCHCKMCRKFHGAAFATFGEARNENFRWITGKNFLKYYKAENGTTRTFCGQCGTSLCFSPSNDSGEFVQFSLGTLDSPISRKPDAHIFVGYKANWLSLNDDLPKFIEGRDSRQVSDDN